MVRSSSVAGKRLAGAAPAGLASGHLFLTLARPVLRRRPDPAAAGAGQAGPLWQPPGPAGSGLEAPWLALAPAFRRDARRARSPGRHGGPAMGTGLDPGGRSRTRPGARSGH